MSEHIVWTHESSPVVETVKRVLTEHGTKYLYPDDEFDCCAEEVVLALRNEGWL